MQNIIKPNWPAPKNIVAYTTTRQHGDVRINENRKQLRESLQLPNEPIWLEQIHSTIAICADQITTTPKADATYTTTPNTICVAQTADCLPILLCNKQGTEVAAIHAGWRGLLAGIIEATIKKMQSPTDTLLAWFGPAIGPNAFEIGNDVRDQFLQADTQSKSAFTKHTDKTWLANLYTLGTQRLNNSGVTAIHGGDYCTLTDDENFFSFRRDKEQAGRMASLIWIR